MASVTTTSKRKTAKSKRPTKSKDRSQLVDAIMGKYAWVPYSSEDFNRDKRREIGLENRA